MKKSIVVTIRMLMILLGIFIVAGISFLSYFIMEKNLLSNIQESVVNIAQIAAASIDGDVHNSITADDGENDNFLSIRDTLSLFLEGENVEYIYSMKEENGKIVFVVDADPEEPADIMEVYDDAYDNMFRAARGEVVADAEISTDEWGSVLSGFAPIYDHQGKACGFVGVDYDADSILAKTKVFRKNLLVVDAICVVLVLLVGIVPSIVLKKRIRVINDKLADVAFHSGDLTEKVEMHSKDEFEEIANNLNGLLERTRKVVASVKNSSGTLQEIAGDVDDTMDQAKDGMDQVSGRLQNMIHGLEQTGTSMEKILEKVEAIEAVMNELGTDAMSGARTAIAVAEKSRDIILTTEKTKSEINEKSAGMKNRLDALVESAKCVEEIETLTADILSISTRTRMLALNANIEAARAGEMGKGFAVVAGNIGSLAANTAQAAEGIQTVSRQVTEVVSKLSVLAEELLEYVKDQTDRNMEEMITAGDQYVEDAEKIRQMMDVIEERVLIVSDEVFTVREKVQEVTESSAANIEDIYEVGGVARKLDDQMNHTVSQSQRNKSHADALQDIVAKYIV